MHKVKFRRPFSNEGLQRGIAYHEKAFGFSFQDHESLKQYVAFYRSCGAGYWPLPHRYETNQGSLLITFFANLAPHPEYSFDDDGDSVFSCTKALEGSMIRGNVNDALIIAGGTHLSIGLVIRGKCIGKVFALEDIKPLVLDDEMDDIPSDIEGITKLGDSFEEFINALSADEDDIEEWEEDFGE
ncbi:hypothetical protein PsW64_03645 [Pseudovibrio sp. W64]|uniref:hypothetical protein n=1 Tax=Pseudovibrio sp. W64 TaxID=1735583 RepID=UPI0007AEE2B1|nr:hypothetical protein [Pseudovibrio sp. W64]KZK78007.1 hypothetical protein PsW64_03645 [Pseudovibrio sp. W64]